MKNQHNRTHTNPRFMMPSTVPGHIGQKEGRGRKLFPPGSFGFPSPGVLASKTSHKAVLLQLRCLGKDLGLKFEIEAMSRCLGHQYININEYKKIYQIHILICIYHYIYIYIYICLRWFWGKQLSRHSFSAGDWQHIFVTTRCEGCGWRPSSLGARHRGCVSGHEKSLQITFFFWVFNSKLYSYILYIIKNCMIWVY